MAKITLLDPLVQGKGIFGHRHFLRDWTGGWMPGLVPFPPLDIMYAAAFLRKHGHTVSIIEASVKHLSHNKMANILKKERPDFVLLPSTYLGLEDDKYLSRIIRKHIPALKIIFSSPFVTYNPSLVLSDNSADFVALGELELSLLNILKGDYSENVAYKKNGAIVYGKRTLIDLAQLPIPARDLIDNQAYKYYAFFNKRNPLTPMTISRGCPHSKCEFCHSSIYSLGQARYRPFDSIIEELNEIVFKYKIGEIFFRDQVFTGNRDLVMKMCEYIISRNINIVWRASTRVDLVDKELLACMQRAGCYQISFGFESNSQKSLDINNKGITVEQSKQAARWAREAGLEVVGLFICGMLGDNKASVKKICRFALDLDIDYANFKEFFIVPGSPFYQKHGSSIDVSNFFPSRLAKLYTISAFLKFYLRPKYLLKQFKKVKTWQDFYFLVKAGLSEFLFHF